MPCSWRAVATPGRDFGADVEGGVLVRVLAVAQRAGELAAEGAPGRRASRRSRARTSWRSRRHRRRCARTPSAPARGGSARRVAPPLSRHLGEQARVVGDVDDHGDVGVVLGRGADHRRAADVDVLDHLVERRRATQRVLERIEIDDQQIDRRDAVGDHRRLVGGLAADRQQAAVDARMQRLQPAVHHLGKSGQLGDVDDLEAGLRQRRGGAAGRDDLDAARFERLAQFDEAGLVGNRDQGAADRREIKGHGRARRLEGRISAAPYHALAAPKHRRRPRARRTRPTPRLRLRAGVAGARRKSRRGRTGAARTPADGRARRAVRRPG